MASVLFEHCLNGESWSEAQIDQLTDSASTIEGSRALFADLVEPLGDQFEPRLSEVYGRLFARVIERVTSGLDARDLVARYDQVRKPRRYTGDRAGVKNVCVLSRVTLGADVAVTSVFLDAAKRTFPSARIWFAGPRKNWELFSADHRVAHIDVPYPRGGVLRDRLAVWPGLRSALERLDAVVLDPDSRMTQLGLLPVCDAGRYYFFDSRSYGAGTNRALGELARGWIEETFGVSDARAYIDPEAEGQACEITVSLGVGGNESKRVADPFEEELLGALAATGASILVDTGAGGEEAERVERSVSRAEGRIRLWRGAFAPFAASVARSRLYVGYDSAAQHVAAACGVPLVAIFAGAASQRFFSRWRPSGAGAIEVVEVASGDPPPEVLRRVEQAMRRIGPVAG